MSGTVAPSVPFLDCGERRNYRVRPADVTVPWWERGRTSGALGGGQAPRYNPLPPPLDSALPNTIGPD